MMNSVKTSLPSILVLTLMILVSSCTEGERTEETEQIQAERDSLANLLERQQHSLDSLAQITTSPEEDGYPILFGRAFRDIEDPERFVSDNLRQRPELITLDAVLGGTMVFRKIDVLSEKWVMAIYDDGHIQGQAIYEYRLLPNQQLEFELLVSDHPQ